jgi:hypothetical protein
MLAATKLVVLLDVSRARHSPRRSATRERPHGRALRRRLVRVEARPRPDGDRRVFDLAGQPPRDRALARGAPLRRPLRRLEVRGAVPGLASDPRLDRRGRPDRRRRPRLRVPLAVAGPRATTSGRRSGRRCSRRIPTTAATSTSSGRSSGAATCSARRSYVASARDRARSPDARPTRDPGRRALLHVARRHRPRASRSSVLGESPSRPAASSRRRRWIGDLLNFGRSSTATATSRRWKRPASRTRR